VVFLFLDCEFVQQSRKNYNMKKEEFKYEEKLNGRSATCNKKPIDIPKRRYT